MWRYKLYTFSIYAKYIGIAGLVLMLFSDAVIFKWLCLSGLLVFVEIALNFSVFKCSLRQMIGIIKVERKYGESIPSVDNDPSKIKYNLPFEGEWTVVNGCFTKDFSHSWDIPAQRYAYDFLILDEAGETHRGDLKENRNYYCYGKAVLAPADGIVAEIANRSADSMIIKEGKFYSRASHIAGNYIVIRHGDHEYSMLAHLKKDSILVSVGQQVYRGQKVAVCGNSGNSSEPHLHFQLQDGSSFYDNAGLPIRFSDIRLVKAEYYSRMDTRPHMAPEKIPEGRITRGYTVSNN